MNILQDIVARRKLILDPIIAKSSRSELEQSAKQGPKLRNFVDAINAKLQQNQAAVIAQPTKASPSQGIIREDFNLEYIVKSLQQGQATCLSILTDQQNFQGGDEHLAQARQLSNLPLLCKDFIFTEYQVYRARALGADCILLIAAICSPQQLQELTHLAHELNMSVLPEIHDANELQSVLDLPSPLVGVNNRNLKTLDTEIQTSIDLVTEIPDDKIMVSESGIHTKAQVEDLRRQGIHTFLVGESLMRAKEPGEKLRELF